MTHDSPGDPTDRRWCATCELAVEPAEADDHPTCPACGGPVVETTVGACCGGTSGVYDSPETAVLACDDCDERLFTFDDDPVTD